MKKTKIFALLFALVVIISATGTAMAEPAHMKRIKLAANVINEMSEQSDYADLANVIKSGRGVAIFPSVGKAGFIFGAQGGQGIVLIKNDDGTWAGPAFVGIAGASVGLQIGIQSTALVLVITNENGLRAFTGGNSFKLGADVSIAAGPVGRDASAATDGRAAAAIYSYSMSKGVYAGVSVDGCIINQNRDASKAYWGAPLNAKAALSKPASDKRIRPVTSALRKLLAKK